jgi:uncharacterized DUF497 family protein
LTRRFIDELRVSAGAQEELSGHGLREDDAFEVSWNRPVFVRDKVDGRDMMIGRNDGGEILTVVIEWTGSQGVCDVVTGWRSSKGEVHQWQQGQPRRTR